MLPQLKKLNPFTSKGSMSEKQLGYLLVAPALFVICAVAVYPILRAIWLSLHEMNLKFGTPNFIVILSTGSQSGIQFILRAYRYFWKQ